LHDILPAVPQLTRKIAGSQLDKHTPRRLFGRETELAALDAAWANGTLNIYTLVAWGGPHSSRHGEHRLLQHEETRGDRGRPRGGGAFFDGSSSGLWRQVSPNLTEADQGWLLGQAAFNLRALGRLTEALQPMRAGLDIGVRRKDWKNAAIGAGNLSELEVTLGRLPEAVTDARQAIIHADQSDDMFQQFSKRSTTADVLHQSGLRAEAGTFFDEAEQMQWDDQPQFDLLYSIHGFCFCDWLLAPVEQAAWRRVANQTISNSGALISDDLAAAVNGLRESGQLNNLPRGLLTASRYHFIRGEHDHAELARAAQLIRDLGYGRRFEELADAEAAAKSWAP
jgi:hypothetical protein